MPKIRNAKPKRHPKKRKPRVWRGWYFAQENETLRHGDGRKIKAGITHKVACKPILCKAGLHASPTVLQALQYAPGNILYRVELRGKRVDGDDKSVATERKYIARIDAEKILRKFARKCALEVIHLWKCPRIVEDYLKTGDESLRAAALDAAWAAALDAAGDAAWDAAGYAARDAAWDAAWDAAGYAARDAAWAAARDAAWAAALDAARDATWDAARAAQSKILDKMVLAAMKKKKRK